MNKQDKLKILAGAKELLITKGWTQKRWASNEHGGVVSWADDAAVQFCMVGAMHRTCRKLGFFRLDKIQEELAPIIKKHVPPEYAKDHLINSNDLFPDVHVAIDVLTKAEIEIAEQQE